MVPDIKSWELYRYQNTSSEVFFRLPGHNSLLATNKMSNNLLYDHSACVTDRGFHVCNGLLVETLTRPVTCVEWLLKMNLERSIGNLL